MSLIFYHFLQLMSFTMERMRLRVSLLFIHPFSIVHLKYRLFLARKRIPLPFFAEMLVDIYFWPLINLSLPFVRYPFVGVGNWNLFFFFFFTFIIYNAKPKLQFLFNFTFSVCVLCSFINICTSQGVYFKFFRWRICWWNKCKYDLNGRRWQQNKVRCFELITSLSE